MSKMGSQLIIIRLVPKLWIVLSIILLTLTK